MGKGKGSLFNPANQKSGGFFDDVDAEIVGARVGTWEEAPEKCYLIVDLKKLDGSDEEPRTEYYTIGNLDTFSPSADGTSVVYEENVRMVNSTKAALLFKSLINAGLSEDKIDDDVTFLVGIKAHWGLQDLQIKGDSKGFKGKKKEDGKGPQVLLVTKLLDEAAAPAKATAGKGTPAAAKPTAAAKPAAAAPAAAPAGDDAAEAAATGTMLELLEANGGKVLKKLLPNLVFKAVKDADERKATLKLTSDAAWLGHGDRPWTFNAETGEVTS